MSAKTIMIIDDDKNIIEIIKMYLLKAGYEVIFALTARAGLELIREKSPDLVLMDVMLPDMNGAEAVQELQNDPQTAQVPVVFLTAMISKSEEIRNQLNINVEGREYPAVAKPLDQGDLMNAVRSHLR